jgi:hypothetical protein
MLLDVLCPTSSKADSGEVARVVTWAYKRVVKFMWVLTVAAFLSCTVWLAISLHEQHVETHDIGLLVAFFFVMAGLPIAIWEIGMHLQYYTRPDVQKFIIRILWMVPIYAITSWLALCFTRHAIYFNTLRGCYEAYVIYSFYMYLVTILGGDQMHGEEQIISLLETKPETEHHSFPFCWLPTPRMGEPFLHMCRRGVLAYVAIRLLTALVAYPLEIAGVYDDGEVDFGRGYIYLSLVNNAGAAWAMYCLFAFYTTLQAELEPIGPIPKFLCVKLVVFFSYWQGFTLAILAWSGVLHQSGWTETAAATHAGADTNNWQMKDIQTGCQNFLICCEMFFAALAHHYAFSYKEYILDDEQAQIDAKRPWCDMLWVLLEVDDVKRGFNDEMPYEVSASAQHHIDEQARLLRRVADKQRPRLNWVLEKCFGKRFENSFPGNSSDAKNQEDGNQDEMRADSEEDSCRALLSQQDGLQYDDVATSSSSYQAV